MSKTWSPDVYLKAFQFAAAAHQGQTLAGSPQPYILHICMVAMEVISALRDDPACDGDLAVQCALLHDVVEDTSVSLADIEREFGPHVAAGVAALTKDAALPKHDRMADSLRRIQRQPREVAFVKLADRINNLREPPPHWNAAKQAEYLAEAGVILAALGAAHPGLAARLAAKMQEYPRFAAEKTSA